MFTARSARQRSAGLAAARYWRKRGFRKLFSAWEQRTRFQGQVGDTLSARSFIGTTSRNGGDVVSLRCTGSVSGDPLPGGCREAFARVLIFRIRALKRQYEDPPRRCTRARGLVSDGASF